MASDKIEIIKLYHSSLRDEALLRLRLSHQLDIAKLVVLAALLGIGNTEPIRTNGTPILLYLVPPVAFLFDMYLVYNFRMLHSIGKYTKDVIDGVLVPTLGELPSGWVSWESWVSQSRQRIWDGLGRLVQFLFTVGATIVAVYLLGLPIKSLYVGLVTLMLLIDMWLIGFLQKFSGKYYV